MHGYLITDNKKECYGCGACYQVCPVQAIFMQEDEEGFRYLVINQKNCINCDRCKKVCPAKNPEKNNEEQTA